MAGSEARPEPRAAAVARAARPPYAGFLIDGRIGLKAPPWTRISATCLLVRRISMRSTTSPASLGPFQTASANLSARDKEQGPAQRPPIQPRMQRNQPRGFCRVQGWWRPSGRACCIRVGGRRQARTGGEKSPYNEGRVYGDTFVLRYVGRSDSDAWGLG